ncbi:MAG: heme peroxidase family protein [Acidobacteriota bacterium]|nr:heme peroxidase family protein [Acidobacteriota bacterium]
MPRISHGAVVTLEQVNTAVRTATVNNIGLNIPFSLNVMPNFKRFDFLFPKLQNNPNNLLPESPQTVEHLKRLGQTMLDASVPGDNQDSPIPAGYTYLGQFIDHDITFEVVSGDITAINDPNLAPLSVEKIRESIKNSRTATLDLDSIYDTPAPRDGDKMVVGKVTSLNGTAIPTLRPVGKDDDNDLPREPRQSDTAHDRAALTGDPRNDENTIIGQLHTAFLRAHNALVAQGKTFDEARILLRQHYQWIIVNDFLKRIADPKIVNRVKKGNQVYKPNDYSFFMPLEFTVAAYRFGHTMIRKDYDFNLNFNTSGLPAIPATLDLLFTFTALSGNLGGGVVSEQGTDTLPDNWIIEWEHFVDIGRPFNKARRFDTKLVEPLFQLKNTLGQPLPDEARLAVRNLLRGYLLRMPTGQSVARALKVTALAKKEIEKAAASDEQLAVLKESGFNKRTPLWFYILAEAAAQTNGKRLGEVGSILVAEVLIGLIRRSENSILAEKNWKPTLGGTPGEFNLADLLKLAGVLG